MRNFFVFNFWFVVHIFIIGALAGFWVHLDGSTLTDSELGQRIGHLLGFWALGLPWFATFLVGTLAGCHFLKERAGSQTLHHPVSCRQQTARSRRFGFYR
ncbi:hypothetical protein [Duganella sp. BuS-21]|uniref:hypothetical protein n=1 Tax=Duganella sp. BuS-21 TaxID=2943848 RepID=UPI0035A665F3